MAEGTAAYLAIASAAIGTTISVVQQNKAQQAKKDADQTAQAQAELENQRSIRQSIAAARLQQAQLLASGQAATGGVDSSGIQGGLAAAQTQQASNIGFARQTLAAASGINNATNDFNRHTSNAATAGALAALSGQFGHDVKSSFQTLFQQPKEVKSPFQPLSQQPKKVP